MVAGAAGWRYNARTSGEAGGRPVATGGTVRSTQPSTLGALLRRHRAAAGLTQEELARRAGVSVRSVSDVERGVSHWPHPDTIARLADALALGAEARASLTAIARRRPSADAMTPLARRAVPRPLTPLIGREHDEAALIHLLRQPEVRLITLTGPPGSGKTRLALQVAAEASSGQFEEAAFVELAMVSDADLAPGAIAQALGARDTSGRSPIETIAAALRDRRALLTLDNCEQMCAWGPSW